VPDSRSDLGRFQAAGGFAVRTPEGGGFSPVGVVVVSSQSRLGLANMQTSWARLMLVAAK